MSDNDPLPMPAHEKARLQTVAYKHVRDVVNTVLKQFKLNTTQLMILGILSESEPPAAGKKTSEIAKTLQVEVPLITTLVQPLIASGYVEQHADERDRRSKPLTLTSPGRELLTTIEAKLASDVRFLEQGMEVDEMQRYFQTLQRLIANGERRGHKRS